MVEVDLMALFGREAVEVAVVGIVGDPLDAVAADLVVDRLRDRGFSRAGAAGDANDDGCLHLSVTAPRALPRSRSPRRRRRRTCCTPPGPAFRCDTRTDTSASRTADR